MTSTRELQHAIEALRQSEATLLGILDAATESIWLFTVDGVCLAGNRTAFARLGVAPEQVVGKHMREIVPADLAVSRGQRLFETAHKREPVVFEDTRAGIRFEHTFNPVFSSGGTVDRIAIFSRDVTERRRMEDALRQSEENFRALAGNAQDSIARFDRDGRFIYVNPTVLRALNKRAEDILGKTTAELGRNEGTDSWEDRLRQVFDSGLPLSFDRMSVEGRWFNVTLSPEVKDGVIVTVLSIARDVTDRRAIEEALRAANEELARADRSKNEFLAILSHELRNPLTPIRNGLEVLRRAEPGSAGAQRAITIIDRQTAQLARLIEDLLDVTRITRNKIQLQLAPLDFNEVVRRALDDVRGLFDQKALWLEVRLADGPLPTRGDEVRLAQIIGNLLHNAVKFTPKGGSVLVTTDRAPDNRLTMRIADTGAGIDPAILGQLFEPFMQAESTLDRGHGGLGLGLALVKGLTEMHGGTVSAHSQGTGKGAQFTVELPLDVSAAPAPVAAHEGVKRGGRRVLIIEDNTDAAESLREALELDGNVVDVAFNGPDGLALARLSTPDIVICDIGLPDMDGYEVARTFRADPALKAVPLLALSGYAQPEDVRRARESGFDRHMAKPPRMDQLRAAVAARLA